MSTLEQILQAQTTFIGSLNTRLNALMTRQYGYKHTAVVTTDLPDDYNAILQVNTNLAGKSAVGILATLKDGDMVSKLTASDTYTYISDFDEGTGDASHVHLLDSDYTFHGENSTGGVEYIKIWYFRTNGTLTLPDDFNYKIVKLFIMNQGDGLRLPMSYVIDTPTVISNTNNVTTPNNENVFTHSNSIVHAVTDVSFTDELNAGVAYAHSIKYLNSGVETLPRGALSAQQYLLSVNLPNLLTIEGRSGALAPGFYNSSKIESISFPKLVTINDGDIGAEPFYNIPNVTLPATVQYVGKCAIRGNQKVVLNCKDAVFNVQRWSVGAPSVEFTMCSDWGADIDIHEAATSSNGWGTTKFSIPPEGEENNPQYLYALLRDYGSEWVQDAHKITIPSAYYTDALKDYFKNKNWTLYGA